MGSVSALLLLLFLPPTSALLAVAARSLTNLAWWWPTGSSSSSMRKLGKTVAPEQAALDELMSVSRYAKGGGESNDGPPAAADPECVVCLSGIEEGDEVRELRCRHLFHRGCLDEWLHVARPPATCPLCRCRLLTSSADDDGEEEEEDLDMVVLIMMASAYVQSSCSWLWPS